MENEEDRCVGSADRFRSFMRCIASIKLSSSLFSNSFLISDKASDPRDHSNYCIMVLGSLTKNDTIFLISDPFGFLVSRR